MYAGLDTDKYKYPIGVFSLIYHKTFFPTGIRSLTEIISSGVFIIKQIYVARRHSKAATCYCVLGSGRVTFNNSRAYMKVSFALMSLDFIHINECITIDYLRR